MISTRQISRFIPLIVLVVLCAGAPASADPFDSRPKLLLHVAGVTTKNICAQGQIDCSSAVTAGGIFPGSPHFVYLLAARGSLASLASVQLGIMYDGNCPLNIHDGSGLDIFAWNLCGDYQFSATSGRIWPEPGSGTLIIWDIASNCQTGPTAVAGYFYVGAYNADRLQLLPRPEDGVAVMATCQQAVFHFESRDLGSAEFSAGASVSGCNPCLQNCPDPVIPPPLGCPNIGPKILLHIGAVTTKNTCTAGNLTFCRDAVVKAGLSTPPDVGPYYFVYLMTERGTESGIAGLQCGITYQDNQPDDDADHVGIDIFDWTLCANFEGPQPSPAWPKPGSGNLISWNGCPTGGTAVAGYFYLGAYSTDVLRVIARPVDGVAKVANCSNEETTLADGDLGRAAFTNDTTPVGCNPCLVECQDAIPVQPTTWSGIKTLYAR